MTPQAGAMIIPAGELGTADLPQCPGVYALSAARPGLGIYVGQAMNIRERCRHHVHALDGGGHENSLLQKLWREEGGIEHFRFAVLETFPRDCLRETLLEAERNWIGRATPLALNLAGNTVRLEASAAVAFGNDRYTDPRSKGYEPTFDAMRARAAADGGLSHQDFRVLLILFDIIWGNGTEPDWSPPTTRRDLLRVSRLRMSRATFNAALGNLIGRGYLEERKVSTFLFELHPSPRLFGECTPRVALAMARVEANFAPATALDSDSSYAMNLVDSSSSRRKLAPTEANWLGIGREPENTPSVAVSQRRSPKLAPTEANWLGIGREPENTPSVVVSQRRSPKLAPTEANTPSLTPEQTEVAHILRSVGIGKYRETLARMPHMTAEFVEAHIALWRSEKPRKRLPILIIRLRDSDPLPFVCPICGSVEDNPHHFLMTESGSSSGNLFPCPFEDGYNTKAEVEEAFGSFQVMGRR